MQIDILLLFLRLELGVFFLYAGLRKLFSPTGRILFYGLLNRIGHGYAYPYVGWGQLLGGLGLLTGTLTHFAAGGLALIMVGALALVTAPNIAAKPPEGPCHAVYLATNQPEVPIMLALAPLAFFGGGHYSMDWLLSHVL